MNQEQKQAEEKIETADHTADSKTHAANDAVQYEPTTSEADQSAEDSRSKGELLAEVTRLTQELQDVNTRLLRVTADFDNFRRRTRQEKEELGQYAAMKLIQEVLPVLDNFQLALAAETADAQSLKQGIEMVFRQFHSILEKEGVKSIEAVGQPFNPNYHEAVMQVESGEYESGIVVEELRKGYLLHDKVVRPAMVKVAQ